MSDGDSRFGAVIRFELQDDRGSFFSNQGWWLIAGATSLDETLGKQPGRYLHIGWSGDGPDKNGLSGQCSFIATTNCADIPFFRAAFRGFEAACQCAFISRRTRQDAQILAALLRQGRVCGKEDDCNPTETSH